MMAGTPYTPTALGRAIHRRRVEQGMKASELAGKAKYADDPPVSIYRIEKGEMSPSPEKLALIAKALKCSVGELLSLAETYTVHPAPESPKTSVTRRAMFGPQASVNDQKQRRLERTVQRNQDTTDDLLERFEEASGQAAKRFLEPLYGVLGEVGDVPLTPSTSSPSNRLQLTYDQHAEKVAREIVRTSGEMAAVTGVGAAAGATAAAAAYGATAAFASASTGAAISTLSGAAATSATLAALGGGSLATGGMGMAAGTMLLSGLIAAPILIAAGAFAVYKGRKWRREAREHGEALDEALHVLEDMRQPLFEMWNWMEIQQAILADSAKVGSGELEWLNGRAEQRLDWGESPESDDRVQRIVDLAAAIYLLLSLPVMSIVNSRLSEEANLTTDEEEEIRRWVDEVASQARELVDRCAADMAPLPE